MKKLDFGEGFFSRANDHLREISKLDLLFVLLNANNYFYVAKNSLKSNFLYSYENTTKA